MRGRDQTAMPAASRLIGAILGRSRRGCQFSVVGHWITVIRGLVTGIAFLATSTVPSIAGDAAMSVGPDARPALALLPADYPEGIDAAVKLISLKRAANLRDPTVSTFIVDYEPGGSAMLHRRPSAGYVLVYILSGSIQAQAWNAGIGVHRSGETWTEPNLR